MLYSGESPCPVSRESLSSPGSNMAPSVTIYEVLTPDWAARELNAKPKTNVRVHAFFSSTATSGRFSLAVGHIVMEYIDAPDCAEEDVAIVVHDMQALIGIRGPSSESAPGHVGGDPGPNPWLRIFSPQFRISLHSSHIFMSCHVFPNSTPYTDIKNPKNLIRQ